jgi:hypothetical protein
LARIAPHLDDAVGTVCWQMGDDHADTEYCVPELRMNVSIGLTLIGITQHSLVSTLTDRHHKRGKEESDYGTYRQG